MQSYDFIPPLRGGSSKRSAHRPEPQLRGWPAIQSGRHVVISAPTGSGKTLAAFLASLDVLFAKASRPIAG